MKLHALSKADVDRLLATRSPQARIETMAKLVQDLESGTLEDNERTLAVDVLHCFAADAEMAVREAVAWQIHNSPLLSLDLAEKLAKDVARVAFPVLRHATNLSEAFLLQVLATRDSGKQLAIAGRATVSAAVSEALVEDGNVAVITCLLRNPGADIADDSLTLALDRFGRIRTVSDAMAARPALSMAVVEKLIAFVSTGIRATLMRSHGVPPDIAERLVDKGRESAMMQILTPLLRQSGDVESMARWLQANGRLTNTLLFRALCAGDVGLFVAGLAARAGVPTENARVLAWDDGPLGLRAVFQKAGIPQVLLMPFHAAIAVAKDMRYQGEEERRDAFQAEVIARVFEECTPTDEWSVDDLLLQLFDQKSEEVIVRAMDQAGLPFLPVR